MRRVLWFLDLRSLDALGQDEARAFLQYVRNGHKDGAGRWGNSAPCNRKPVSDRTLRDYYTTLTTFFRWCVAEGFLDVNPLERQTPPIVRADQPEPFSLEQVATLVHAAQHTTNPKRDEAILRVLFDCGLRASELCDLKREDVDLHRHSIRVVEGKGGKDRSVFFGRETLRALFAYLQQPPFPADKEPLFRSDRGTDAGAALGRHGLRMLLNRLAKAAGIRGVHPHRFRHTFAVTFLRNGGNQFSLQTLLGHTSPAMTARYVRLSQADLSEQHRRYSPGDMIGGRGKGR